jgi:hypothetical protein
MAGTVVREAKFVDEFDQPLMGGGLVRCLQRRRGLRRGGREVFQMPALLTADAGPTTERTVCSIR